MALDEIRRITEPAYYRFCIIPRARRAHDKMVANLRKQGSATIAFIVSSLPMWRFQLVYDRMKQDNRFHVHIVLFPFSSFTPEQRDSSIRQLRNYFNSLGIPVTDLSNELLPGSALKSLINPDIIFYPQPYNRTYQNDLDCSYFSDRLLCYIPYAMLTAKENWAYKCHFNNIAWRLFFQSTPRFEEAKKVLFNHGDNIRITGEPVADLFQRPEVTKIWKPQPYRKKRVIWAPHYSITHTEFLNRNSFIWLSEAMWNLAILYKEQLQFAFKPHPKLLSVLYETEGWGREKADSYYQKWAEGDNTQLETGNYIDLFKTSDAMIHDSSSFSVEYHYTGKPVMFTTINLVDAISNLNEFGRDAILAHYHGSSSEQVKSFIDNVVIAGNDPKKKERLDFFKNYLQTPGNTPVSENIYREIVNSIWG